MALLELRMMILVWKRRIPWLSWWCRRLSRPSLARQWNFKFNERNISGTFRGNQPPIAGAGVWWRQWWQGIILARGCRRGQGPRLCKVTVTPRRLLLHWPGAAAVPRAGQLGFSELSRCCLGSVGWLQLAGFLPNLNFMQQGRATWLQWTVLPWLSLVTSSWRLLPNLNFKLQAGFKS